MRYVKRLTFLSLPENLCSRYTASLGDRKMSSLRINISKNDRLEFLCLLKENDVEFVERHPPLGVVVAYGRIIEIISILGPPIYVLIATVLELWLRKQASRRIIIHMKDHRIVHLSAQGYSIEEVKQILPDASTITPIQPKPDDRV